MTIFISVVIGVLIGITLDELFAGKVVNALKHELNLLHEKLDLFINSVHKKLDAIFDKIK